MAVAYIVRQILCSLGDFTNCSASSIDEARVLRTSFSEGRFFSLNLLVVSPDSHSVGVTFFCLGVGGFIGEINNLRRS